MTAIIQQYQNKKSRLHVAISGAAGYLGRVLLEQLLAVMDQDSVILALDIHPDPDLPPDDRIRYHCVDVRSPELGRLLAEYQIGSFVHLASIVNPGNKQDRQRAYSIDVEGSRNVMEACLHTGVLQFVYLSSGAAYGYHSDNPAWIDETCPLRGNYEFAYAWHKKLVEEMLAGYRQKQPQLSQLILRPGTILGQNVRNQITGLFQMNPIPAVKGSESPFVFIWDQDVAAVITIGLLENKTGIFNLAGDGCMTLAQIASRQGTRIQARPAWLLQLGLWFMRLLRITPYGPEQVRFLAWRPVLANQRLKTEFGYQPRLDSVAVFDFWLGHGGNAA
ncbi:MAG: SDR family oxidoreductase [Leptospiraceae bacterium]|nr:SDR family oxidoreductase [Leptospiraceae bacterium]